ncbi:MAG: hypothetical protein MZV64_03745 [Ignavibacteriales bacterium]|nr:hypothetical protein [Ignavibacteriales bacterium]
MSIIGYWLQLLRKFILLMALLLIALSSLPKSDILGMRAKIYRLLYPNTLSPILNNRYHFCQALQLTPASSHAEYFGI